MATSQAAPDFYFRKDGNKYRVWRSCWSGDQFEVLHHSEFTEFQSMCKRFSMWMKEVEDDDDDT